MSITKRQNGYQVRVERNRRRWGSWLKGATYLEAQQREDEMRAVLDRYGVWPAPEASQSITIDITPDRGPHTIGCRVDFERTRGTLAAATVATLANGWKDMRYDGRPYLRTIAAWLITERSKRDLDALTKDDIEAYVAHRQDQEIAASTINKELAALRKACEWAQERTPPLMTKTLKWHKARPQRIAKWWLPPDKLEALLVELRTTADRPDLELFADYIEVICKSGIRVEEAGRLRVRHLVAEQELEVPGTKTERSHATIGISKEVQVILRRRIASVKQDPEALLFPLSYRWAADRWALCRGWLGAENIPTATLKALRRTFAKLANRRGMPTETIRNILRHSSITTTQGYLDLAGDEQKLEEQKKWL